MISSLVKKWEDLGPRATIATPLQRFQFFRVRAALRELLGEDLQEPPEIPELSYIIKTCSPSCIVSKIYKLAMEYRANNFMKVRREWQTDLQRELDDKTWVYCSLSTRRISLHGRHSLIHCKFLNRAYYSPERLHRYGLRESAACERCSADPADFFHLAWQCPGIHKFWELIFQELERITDTVLAMDPLPVLLGYSKLLPPAIRRLVDMGLLIAKRQIALHWKKGPTPTITQWVHDMPYCSTQTETFSELLPPSSWPKNLWGLYTTYMLTKSNRTENENVAPAEGDNVQPLLEA